MQAEDLQKLTSEELEIQERLTRTQLAAIDLDAFSEIVYPGYDSSPHQKLLSQKLMEVEKYILTGGKEGIGRLLVEMPPRSGKSLKSTILFPSFFFGRNPDRKIILTSYSDSTAQHFSRSIRDTMESARYQEIFGRTSLSKEQVVINPEGRSIESWSILNRRGELNAAGISGGITGKGCDLLLVDDPVKNRAEADSAIMREDAKEWFGAVAYTRLEPAGAIVLCLTRWHKDDLAGHVLSLGDDWHRLRLPALAEENDPMGREEGQPLWPNKWGLETLERIRKNLPTRDWNALYQQNPTDEEGDVFRMQYFTYGDFPPDNEIVQGFQVIDTAFTEDEANDPSAIITIYVTTWGVFVAHVWEGRLEFNDLERKIAENYQMWNKKHRINRVFIEYKGSGISIVQTLRKKLKMVPILEVKPDSEYGKSKLARAQSITGYLESGNVQFQRGAPWLAKFEEQLMSFPRGKHDDMCLTSHTLVSTIDGWKEISKIKVGEKVLTRQGSKKVLWAGKTGRRKIINKLGIQGTPNHPIWTENRGWVQLQYVKPSDVLVCESKFFPSMANSTFAIRMPKEDSYVSTSIATTKLLPLLDRFIGTYGNSLTDRLRLAIISITQKVQMTIGFLLWNRSLLLSTGENTGSQLSYLSVARDGQKLLGQIPLAWLWQGQKKEKRQPRRIRRNIRSIWIRIMEKLPVRAAEKLSEIINGAFTVFAPPVKKNKDIKKDISPHLINQEKRNVPYVREFFSASAQDLNSVLPNAGVQLPILGSEKEQDVYNLTVEGEHEFFANGILTHNCDVFVYAIQRVQGGGKKKQAKEQYWQPENFQDRHSEIIGSSFLGL